MPTIKSLQDQALALVDEQEKLVSDGKPWNAAKTSQWENRERDIKAVLSQHAAIKAVDGDPLASARPTDNDSGRPFKGAAAGLVQQGYKPVGTPQLELSNEDSRELHEAAVSHRSYSVTSRDWKNAATDSTTIGPTGIPTYRLPPVTMRREPTRVLSLIPTLATDHPTVTWYTTTGTAAAAAVAEGGTKPTSTIAYTAVTGTVTKIAHVAEVTDETLSDFPAFLSTLTQDMTDGLIKAENAELLNATVAGASKFAGLLNTSGILTRAKGADTYFDAISGALDDLRVGTSFTQADGMVMHPTTWGLLRKQKDSNNAYYIQPDVTQDRDFRIWGVPVVLTTQIAAGTVLVGDFGGSTVAYVRDGIKIEVANQGTTQFTTNTTLVRAEERLLVTAPRPTGLLKLTGVV